MLDMHVSYQACFASPWVQDSVSPACPAAAPQEVSIMRKVRHKNVVQFIGACTRKPNLCIVVEYMPGGSVYDYMRRVRQQALP